MKHAPRKRGPARRPWTEHLWKRIDKRPDGHWLWLGHIDRGHAFFSWTDEKGRPRASTGIRAVLEALQLRLPKSPIMRMDCGQKHCVNPEHMTIANDDRDTEIRRRWALPKKWKTTIAELALENGISRQRVDQIINGTKREKTR